MADDVVKARADVELPALAPAAHLPSSLPSDGRALFERHAHLICQRLERLSQWSTLPERDAEELRSWALSKLIENDYRILASWKGLSSFPTFLAVVLVDLLRHYRTRIR